MNQYVLDLIRLLYFNADSDTVNARFDQNFLVLIAGDGQRIKEHFWRAGGFNLGNIVAFRCLGCKIRKRECRSEGGPDAEQVRTEGLRLMELVSYVEWRNRVSNHFLRLYLTLNLSSTLLRSLKLLDVLKKEASLYFHRINFGWSRSDFCPDLQNTDLPVHDFTTAATYHVDHSRREVNIPRSCVG